MTHPALFSVEDAIDALDAAISLDGLSLIQRTVLRDLRDDLKAIEGIDTTESVARLAMRSAHRGY